MRCCTYARSLTREKHVCMQPQHACESDCLLAICAQLRPGGLRRINIINSKKVPGCWATCHAKCKSSWPSQAKAKRSDSKNLADACGAPLGFHASPSLSSRRTLRVDIMKPPQSPVNVTNFLSPPNSCIMLFRREMKEDAGHMQCRCIVYSKRNRHGIRDFLHGLTKCLVGQRRRERRLRLEDGGLAIDKCRFRLVAQQLALAVVRIVELAKTGLLDRAVGQLKKMARHAGRLNRGRRIGAIECLEVLVRLVRAVSDVAVHAAGIAAITLVRRGRGVGLGLGDLGLRILK